MIAGAAAALAATGALGAGAVSANNGSYNFPNGCNITWYNSFNGYFMAGWTYEASNCASLQTRIAYTNTSGLYAESGTAYLNSSTAYISKNAIDGFWSDHNGRNTTNGIAYGIRRSV